MVLVHKLRQMEELDIEQFREHEQENIATPQSGNEENDPCPPPLSAKGSARALSPPRRPLTRSQTGRVMKRRHRDDSPAPAPHKPPPPRKRARTSKKPPPKKSEENTMVEKPTAPPSPDVPSAVPHNPDIPPPSNSGLTFLETSSSSSVMDDHRVSKSKVILPVPVPNLTKKSRGRRVPTALVSDKDGEQRATRLYVCDADGCGKCFNRGEHLKRHIRSIHTHEKPFKCSYPACDKFFNRHDNLLQHLKVHKELVNPQPSYPDVSTAPVPALSQPHLYPPLEETHENVSIRLNRSQYHHQGSFPTYSTTTPYGSILENTGFATNMAVSSLRTELPLSPSAHRPHDMASSMLHPVC